MDTNVTTSADKGSLSLAGSTKECVKPPFLNGVTGLKLSEALRHLYHSFQIVPACVLGVSVLYFCTYFISYPIKVQHTLV